MLNYWRSLSTRGRWMTGISAFCVAVTAGFLVDRAAYNPQIIAPIISAMSATIACVGALIAYHNLRSNRAWMMPLDLQCETFIEQPFDLDLQGERRISVRQGWVNGGKSPALQFRHSFRMQTVPTTQPMQDFSPSIEGDIRGTLVGPNQEKKGSWLELTDGQVAAILRGNLNIYVHALCFYTDIYSRVTRETHVCTHLQISVDPRFPDGIRIQTTPTGPLNFAT